MGYTPGYKQLFSERVDSEDLRGAVRFSSLSGRYPAKEGCWTLPICPPGSQEPEPS